MDRRLGVRGLRERDRSSGTRNAANRRGRDWGGSEERAASVVDPRRDIIAQAGTHDRRDRALNLWRSSTTLRCSGLYRFGDRRDGMRELKRDDGAERSSGRCGTRHDRPMSELNDRRRRFNATSEAGQRASGANDALRTREPVIEATHLGNHPRDRAGRG